MGVERLVLGPLDNNCFVVRCRSSNDAVIIDAATDAPSIIAAVASSDVRAILTTHGHGDHVGAARELGEHFGAPIMMHSADAFLTGWAPDRSLSHGDSVEIGSLTAEVIHTPGHTPGSVCLRVDEHLFTGDTLFPGGPGATRFPYSNFDQIMESLETRLFTMPDSSPFHPGHGASSTIGEERAELETWRRRRW